MGSVSHEVTSKRHDAGQHTMATLPLHGSSSRLLKKGLTGSRKRAGCLCVCVYVQLPICVRASLSVCLCLCLFLWVVCVTDARMVQRGNHERHKGKLPTHPSQVIQAIISPPSIRVV